MAIDEVRVLNGVCPSSATCDFETTDLCGYVNDVNAGIKWSRTSGKVLRY